MALYPHTLDPKGRVIIPSKMRDDLGGDRIVITNGFETCLYAYSASEWEKIEEAISNLPTTSEKVRMFERFFIGPAEVCDMDGQGRVLVPQNLREYAKFEKQIYVVGLKRRLEIWDKDLWDSNARNSGLEPLKIAEEMAGLGLRF
ncbi:MAG TPA: division/cell wall cluster transcriptional repressor MraZ [Clostridiales bacterium]|nr:division/cell wall cluster transcriptional repressor MraZ [Clostridiales bacterium]